MIKKFNLLFLTFFIMGKIKYAPGSFASLLTIVIFLFLTSFLNFTFIFFITLIIFLYSFFAINSSFGEFESEDPQEIVIDEVVGQMIVLLAIPIYETLYPLPTIYYCVCSFILFRLFDVLKPYPISYVDENIDGPTGIMLDDIIASIFSIIILCLAFFFLGG